MVHVGDDSVLNPMQTVLNVGDGSKAIDVAAHYRGWQQLRLDIDPAGGADLVCDARLLDRQLPAEQYDAVYCSHNLEHYYPHDGARVLRGFIHVLKPDGFAEIRVPDVSQVIKDMMARGLDLEDELYVSPAGPIRALDVIYGWQVEIVRSGQDFYAHKTGFTAKSLTKSLLQAGFGVVVLVAPIATYELRAIAFKRMPTEATRKLLGLGN